MLTAKFFSIWLLYTGCLALKSGAWKSSIATKPIFSTPSLLNFWTKPRYQIEFRSPNKLTLLGTI